jgi:hypothetical protein
MLGCFQSQGSKVAVVSAVSSSISGPGLENSNRLLRLLQGSELEARSALEELLVLTKVCLFVCFGWVLGSERHPRI